MKPEEFEQEWKRYCDSKGGGAVTMNIKDVAKHFAQWQREQMMKNAIDAHVNMEWNHLSLGGFAWSQTGLGFGDKCKLIIIKE